MKLLKNKRILAIIALVILIIILGLILLLKNRTYTNIYYRTYTKEKGWSSWSKNGKTSGNDYYIKAIQVKVKSSSTGDVFYKVKIKTDWEDNDSLSAATAGNEKDNINNIKAMLSQTLYRKYRILYRAKIDGKWSEWQENYIKLDNEENKPIKQIEMKLELK